MNTAKILDIMPQPAAPGPPPVSSSRPDPQTVPPIGNGATADLIHKRQAQAQAQAADEDRRRSAPKLPAHNPRFDREVGLVDHTFEVFVDLVTAGSKDYRVRIFGPPENPGPPPPTAPTADPASANAAYQAGAAAPSGGSIKADV